MVQHRFRVDILKLATQENPMPAKRPVRRKGTTETAMTTEGTTGKNPTKTTRKKRQRKTGRQA